MILGKLLNTDYFIIKSVGRSLINFLNGFLNHELLIIQSISSFGQIYYTLSNNLLPGKDMVSNTITLEIPEEQILAFYYIFSLLKKI